MIYWMQLPRPPKGDALRGRRRGLCPLHPRAYAACGRALPCTRPCAGSAKGASPFGIPSIACGRDGGHPHSLPLPAVIVFFF